MIEKYVTDCKLPSIFAASLNVNELPRAGKLLISVYTPFYGNILDVALPEYIVHDLNDWNGLICTSVVSIFLKTDGYDPWYGLSVFCNFDCAI